MIAAAKEADAMSARGAVRSRMTVFRSSQGELPSFSSLCRVLAQWKASLLKESIALPVVLLFLCRCLPNLC